MRLSLIMFIGVETPISDISYGGGSVVKRVFKLTWYGQDLIKQNNMGKLKLSKIVGRTGYEKRDGINITSAKIISCSTMKPPLSHSL